MAMRIESSLSNTAAQDLGQGEKRIGDHTAEASAIQESLLVALGTWCVWVLLLGFALIPCVIAFLVFLWASNGENYVWRQIALAGWVSRCISLASSMLRLTIAMQTGVGTSIIAALALQRFEVHLPNAPAVSMVRWQNSGPHVLARQMLSTRAAAPLLYPIIVAMTFITMVAQFTSTILLTDLDQSLTFSNNNLSSFNYGLNVSLTSISAIESQQSSYWLTKPAVFPTFAEYHRDAQREPNVYDTGPTFRALFPIENQTQRSHLRNYTGTATVLDHRVVCVKPKLNFVVGLEGSYELEDLYRQFIRLSGRLALDVPANNSYFSPQDQASYFNCLAPFNPNVFPDQVPETSLEWQVAVCPIGQDNFPSQLYSGSGYEYNYYSFLIFNASGSFNAWFETSVHNEWVEDRDGDKDSEWTRLVSKVRTRDPLGDARLGVSLCLTPITSGEMNISAFGGIPHDEARINWNTSSRSYNTKEMRRSLGAALQYESPTERGHLDMRSMNYEESLGEAGINWAIFDKSLITELSSNRSIFACIECYSGDATSNTTLFKEINSAMSAIFNDIMRYTNHPALGLQAVKTVIAGMAYYDAVQLFTVPATASYVTYVAVVVPTQWVGLPIVIVITILHCILMVTVLVIFARSPKQSLINNAWSAFAQTARSTEIQEWLTNSTMVDDATVEKRMEKSDAHLILVGTDYTIAEAGEVEMRKRR